MNPLIMGAYLASHNICNGAKTGKQALFTTLFGAVVLISFGMVSEYKYWVEEKRKQEKIQWLSCEHKENYLGVASTLIFIEQKKREADVLCALKPNYQRMLADNKHTLEHYIRSMANCESDKFIECAKRTIAEINRVTTNGHFSSILYHRDQKYSLDNIGSITGYKMYLGYCCTLPIRYSLTVNIPNMPHTCNIFGRADALIKKDMEALLGASKVANQFKTALTLSAEDKSTIVIYELRVDHEKN